MFSTEVGTNHSVTFRLKAAGAKEVTVWEQWANDPMPLTWGSQTRPYTATQLADGVNIVADLAANSFLEAFSRVDQAIAEKQKHEACQNKRLFHSAEGNTDSRATAALIEKACGRCWPSERQLLCL